MALSAALWVLFRHLGRLTGTLSELQEELEPRLSRLAADAEVTKAELERITEATERLRNSRR